MPRTRQALIKICRSKIHGRGARAVRRIRAGATIIEYTGERISADEANERYDDDSAEQHHTFLFEVDADTFIDASRDGNEARFINHSCEPNCASYVQDGKVFIEAIKNVQPGTEITYDYRYKRDGRRTAEWERLYPCYCGTPSCRGTMLRPRRSRRSR